MSGEKYVKTFACPAQLSAPLKKEDGQLTGIGVRYVVSVVGLDSFPLIEHN